MNTPTVDELMRRAFDVPRDPRSAEYKQGVRDTLIFRIEGDQMVLAYEIGTAQCDAYCAGREEGHRIWRAHQDKQI
ncbi:hypothetical protein KNO81_12250 [Paraburkholderia sediminicola]|nr:hypothetical protein [Paraburkholderia sediminicola]